MVTMAYTLGVALWLNPTPLFAKELNFGKFLQTAAHQVPSVTSDKQARALIHATMGPFDQVRQDTQNRHRPHKKQPLPEVLNQQMVELAAGVATWRFTNELGKGIEQKDEFEKTTFLDPSNDHLVWLTQSSSQLEFHRTLALAKTYLDLSKRQKPVIDELPHFARYSQYLLQHYSIGTKGEHDLLVVAEKEGASGITQRLNEYWEQQASNGKVNQVSDVSDRQSYATRYLIQHYLPLHRAHLQTDLISLQLRTERHLREIWSKLGQWQQDQKDKIGLMRLCGTWQWLIHNHQNHGDHKTVMIYPPPSEYHRMDPKPAKIQVQGDTVYIRWEFPRGIIQEESLLLSEKDRLLSGTFVNNMGPNGNITGRRVKACRKN